MKKIIRKKLRGDRIAGRRRMAADTIFIDPKGFAAIGIGLPDFLEWFVEIKHAEPPRNREPAQRTRQAPADGLRRIVLGAVMANLVGKSRLLKAEPHHHGVDKTEVTKDPAPHFEEKNSSGDANDDDRDRDATPLIFLVTCDPRAKSLLPTSP